MWEMHQGDMAERVEGGVVDCDVEANWVERLESRGGEDAGEGEDCVGPEGGWGEACHLDYGRGC